MSKIFPEGIFYNKPREGAPEFVRGSLSIQVDKLIPFLEQHKNAQGYVNIDMLLSKEKSLYLALNEWKKPESMSGTPNNINSQPQPVSSLTAQEKEVIQTLRDNESSWNKPKSDTNSDGSKTPNFGEIDPEEVFKNL